MYSVAFRHWLMVLGKIIPLEKNYSVLKVYYVDLKQDLRFRAIDLLDLKRKAHLLLR